MALSDMISVRLASATREQLDAAAEKAGESRSALVQRFVEEGLRMDRHPGIVFRPGPAGRRAALGGAPDVWEIIRVVQNVDACGEASIEAAAQWLGLSPARVRVAVDYYADYRQEVDDWIARVDAEAADAEATWQRRRAALR